jgi:DNA-binding CsgD family transcriptional regulator
MLADGPAPAWTAVQGLLLRAAARRRTGDWDGALADVDTGLIAAGRADHAGLHLSSALLEMRCRIHLQAGRPAEAERFARERYEQAATGPLPGPAALWALWLGRALLLRGAVDEAVVRLREAVALLRPGDFRDLLGPCRVGLAEALALAGRAAEARAALAAAGPVAHGAASGPGRRRPDPEVVLAAARAGAALGDVPTALALCRPVAAVARASGAVADEADALHEMARLGQAATVAARLRHLAGTLSGAAGRYADHAEAVAAGDAAALEAVAAGLARAGTLPLAAEAYQRAAAAHAAAGRQRRAATALLRAAEHLARCPGAAAAHGTSPPPLTPREHEVAHLAAAGLSDRHIAQRLSVSVRTVQNHLHRAYAKLQASGRKDLSSLLTPP